MKKLVLCLSLCVTGCLSNAIPPETIRNPKCLNSHQLEIFQVADDMMLVYLRHCAYGQSVCTPSESFRQDNGKLYAIKTSGYADKNYLYDGSVIGLGDQCAVLNGVYSYTNTMGAKTTVQEITIIHDSQVPNPEYKVWQEQQKQSDVGSSDKTGK